MLKFPVKTNQNRQAGPFLKSDKLLYGPVTLKYCCENSLALVTELCMWLPACTWDASPHQVIFKPHF